MSCEQVRELLQDYATRELVPGERQAVDEHLLECDACRQELAVVSLVVSSLDSQPVLEPGPDFGQKVMAGLPSRRPVAPSPWWVLVLVPLLGGLIYVFRLPLATRLFGLLERGGVDPGWFSRVQLPLPTVQQLTLAPLVIAGLGLVLAVGGGVLFWRYLSERY